MTLRAHHNYSTLSVRVRHPLQSPRNESQVALVAASALEGGRLHTRQWAQLVYDTQLADNQLSVVELNRLSAQCMSHPATRLRVFHDPHGPFRDRVGYYEWIEVLIRAAQVQHARSRGVPRRLEALLTERVVRLGACGRYLPPPCAAPGETHVSMTILMLKSPLRSLP